MCFEKIDYYRLIFAVGQDFLNHRVCQSMHTAEGFCQNDIDILCKIQGKKVIILRPVFFLYYLVYLRANDKVFKSTEL